MNENTPVSASTNAEPKYIIGIDLGTTHCVLAYTPLLPEQPDSESSEAHASNIEILPLLQVISPGEVQEQPLLPSFLFLPGPHDVPSGALQLPWNAEIDYAVGEFARERGSEIPDRLVASAKSWLCYNGVDRTQPILPWNAPKDARRVSPLATISRYLAHLRHAWNEQMAAEDSSARLEAQEIYLTVPASFDAVARELTVEAAKTAGLTNLTLLEEPQAAFYSWLHAMAENWRDEVHVGESVLVCDVGGGTTDFSLIQVIETDGNLGLQRVAVGDHILLGGDNMDLTLAYAVRAKLAEAGTQLDDWQFRSLWHSCRRAKERLLGNPELEAEPVVVLGRGTSLIGGVIRTELTRHEIESILVEGFFPIGPADEFPQQKPQVGMREMGLPYASDPAVTRHLAQFLSKQVAEPVPSVDGGATQTQVAFPTAVLFNGGVMKSSLLREQLVSALRAWSGDEAFRELPSIDLDLAVAMGAVYYGLARRGEGIRIRAGTARTYYIGIESSMPAVPGIPTPINALCVVPFGMEEGSEVEIVEREFGLVVGEPAVFHFLASTTRQDDKAGQIVEDWQGEIHEVTTLETLLPTTDDEVGGTVLPVWLQTRIQPRRATDRSNSVAPSSSDAQSNKDTISGENRLGGLAVGDGVLEIWCIERDGDREWKLEFDVSYHPT